MNEQGYAADFWPRLVDEQVRVAIAGKWYLVGCTVATMAPYMYLDVYAFENDGLYGLMGLVSWAINYVLFVGLMNKAGYLDQGMKTGIGTYFALCIATGIPIALALVMLILPGLYLAMRWLPAFSRAMTTTDGIGNAMRWSWDKTEPVQGSLARTLIIPVLLYAAGIGLPFAYERYYDLLDWNAYVALALGWNFLVTAAAFWWTLAGVAAFGCIEGRDRSWEAVFE
ncbi:hypothetical protein [Parerythrobacter aestuarii]|uniref:hypothetical protein n=1 Tax=Parerythrobacter aestuarii TaxID=3020909 RepID=UPI0024DED175|nr:hypothetical protein [Parerythrobacter aestuarii]